MFTLHESRRAVARRLFARRYELALLASLAGAAACADAGRRDGSGAAVGSARAAMTTAEATTAAQKAIDFMVPDAIAFTQSSGCLSCHRQPDVLMAASTAASQLPGLTLDTSRTTGTGSIADLILTTQASNGSFGSTSLGAEAVWALAGYARSGGAVDVFDALRRGVLYLGQSPATTTFPSDGLVFGGQQRTYVSNDTVEGPQMFDWYLPTAQAVVGARTLLDLAPSLSAADVATLSAQQSSYTDALEGTAIRGLATVTVQDLALAGIALAESGRASTPSAQAIGTQLVARQTNGSGWSDPTLPDSALQAVNALTSSQALFALCRLGMRPRSSASVGIAFDWLVAQQQANGSWLLPGHDADVATSWALLAVSCASNPTGTAEMSPLTASASPGAAVVQTRTATLQVTNTAPDARVATPTFTGAPPGATVTVDPASQSIAGDATASFTVTVVLPPQLAASQSYALSASVAFAAGGASPATTAKAKYTLAVPATVDPVVVATTTTFVAPPSSVTVGTSVPLGAAVADSLGHVVHPGTVTFAVDGASFATVPVSGDAFATTWAVPNGLTPGAHTLRASYGGDTSAGLLATSMVERTISVTVPPPPAPSVGGMTDGASSATGVFPVSGQGTPGDTIAISAGGQVVGTATVQGDGSWSTSITLGPGSFDVSFVESGLGGPSSPTVRHVTVQPSAPAVTGPASGTTFTEMVTTVSGVATPGATITVRRGGVLLGTATAGGDGHYAVGVELAVGPNELAVAQEVNGQMSPLSGIVYNLTPDAPSVTSPAAGALVGARGVIASGLAVPGSSVVLTLDGAVFATTAANGSGAWSIAIVPPGGAHVLRATASVGGVVGAPSVATAFSADIDTPFFPAPPGALTAYAPTAAGVKVGWREVTAYDPTGGPLPATCQPAANSVFPVGSTKVTCSATDTAGNAIDTAFVVDVIQQKVPVLGLPDGGELARITHVPAGGAVAYDVHGTSASGEPLAATCAPASGSFFPVGRTPVTCTVADPATATSAEATFVVVLTYEPGSSGSSSTATTTGATVSSTSASGGTRSTASCSTGATGVGGGAGLAAGALGLVAAAAVRRRRRQG